MREIAAIQDIEDIIREYEAAEMKYFDIDTMFDQTRSLNENVNMFITELENRTPKNVIVNSYASDDNGVSIVATSTEYDEIAKFIIELKKIACIDNAFISDIRKSGDEVTGDIVYTFNVTCNFVSMVQKEELGMEEEATGDAVLDTEVAQ